MIITLTLDKINIPGDGYCCTFSNEMLEKLSVSGLIRRRNMDLGNKESYHCWQSFLRDMVQRGTSRRPLPIKRGAALDDGVKVKPVDFEKYDELLERRPQTDEEPGL